ncbi:unnamed protein product [Paramecium primaurelia]|uniref:Transmembrane protein n=1 Tax=Paramecium primaurelia TaxID=5886 RepID=A0A8S1PP57_PARPR|nr:unnamed protein product [Paramecium primaurelia]
MISIITKILIVYFFFIGFCQDICNQYLSYSQCIGSIQSQCKWDEARNNCHYTNDYMQGCSKFLNVMACQKQLGTPLGQFANCRFIQFCENIPDVQTEKCYNNLSKYGCLIVQNPIQICIWKNKQCYLLETQQQLRLIQDDFEQMMYSASACSLIEHYLVIHSSLLWNLISYVPDLKLEAFEQQQRDLNIEVTDKIYYDDPNLVQMQNNYLMKNGNYAWYKLGLSLQYIKTNLQISNRFREGCIALEILDDNDFLQIFSLQNEIKGVNHIYCKYLNQNPMIIERYIFIDNKCVIFNTNELLKQEITEQYKINCKQLDKYQCIFFNSKEQNCKIEDDFKEYQCIEDYNQYETDCIKGFCTIKQCQKLDNHYIDLKTNMCVNTCTTISNMIECLNQDCKYLGVKSIEQQIICAPPNICNQIGLTKSNCLLLKAKCNWDNNKNKCYELKDNEISLMKCKDALSIHVCTFILLSDQMCYWSKTIMKCINILDQPLLMAHKIFIDRDLNENDEQQVSLVCNMNLCKYNSLIATEFDEGKRICLFDQFKFSNNLHLINKYHCLNNLKGYYQWNQQMQICEKYEQSQILNKQCLELVDVNERFCQYGKLSSKSFLCIYDQITTSCIEKTEDEVNELGCFGNGLSEEKCLNKNVDGQFCTYSDGLCIEISIITINHQQCSSILNVNQQVCRMYFVNQILCKYNELTHSCNQLSITDTIEYNYNLNRYACQTVTDTYTYFDEQINRCIQLDSNDNIYFMKLKCEDNYVNKMTCLKIVTDRQICIWNTFINKCRNYVDNFPSCSFFEQGSSKTCSSLMNKNKIQQTMENYCIYQNNQCKSNIESQIDCGDNEIMNIHRIDQDGQFVQMCAFIDYQCRTLVDQSMDTEIILNTITCEQANQKSCKQIKTPGQYCYVSSTEDINNITLNKGCRNQKQDRSWCYYLNYLFSDINRLNPNICSQASDECVYDSIEGCIYPPDYTSNYDCEHPGLSQQVCVGYTNERRCAFINNICQYISENQIFIDDCSLLNQFACSLSPFIQCIWNEYQRICESMNLDYIQSITSNYFCSSNQNDIFILSGETECIEIKLDEYNLYTCDTPGLNKFGCHSIPKQYCQYLNNKCQYYSPVLCEDYSFECESNDTNDQQCVFQDGQCFAITNTLFDCDSFEKTNYLFCLQYPYCIYKDSKCQQIIEYQQYPNCSSINDVTKCTVQNNQHQCQYQQLCQSLDLVLDKCPSLIGYYSKNACKHFQDCQYGYTKSGYGFCFQGQNILNLTCEQLPQNLCIEDLTHLNSDLKCFLDDNDTCKNIQNYTNLTCNNLSEYKFSYAACMHFGNIDCKYSFQDNKCKLVNEYFSTICQGSSKLQCDLIESICYFNDSICTTSGNDDQINKYGCIHQNGYYHYYQGNCKSLESTNYQQSCHNLSKDACLSKLTKEIHCRWINEKCKTVLKQENKEIQSCQDLNQRVCQEIALSNIQCQWNSEIESCQTITVSQFDCTLADQINNTSKSLCSNQINNYCVRHIDGTKCSIITIKLNSCIHYGLNFNACLELTTIPCIWKQYNQGGYCENANLYSSQCSDLLNEKACMNLKNIGQYCMWDINQKRCQHQEITTCSSANHLNGILPCKAVNLELCQYNELINECQKINVIPTNCSEFYNKLTCIQSTKGCVWNLNSCKQQIIQKCELFLNKYVCLNNQQVGCKWIDNKCESFESISNKIYCVNLPKGLNQFACRSNAIDPCNLNYHQEICISTQSDSQNFDDYFSVSQLLDIQTLDYPQPLLFNQCEYFQTKYDCINSRKKDEPCIWISQCQKVTNFDILKCSDSLNIWGCLKITNTNELCFWNHKCLYWTQDNPIMSNVNINVCINHSQSSIYFDYSCQIKDILLIDCKSIGISKITCLSISNKSCQWLEQFNQCQEFVQDNKQNKCSDYQLISPHVCQMISDQICIHDKNTFSCVETDNNNYISGLSKLACLQNNQKPMYWNESNNCEELKITIRCDSQLKVNSITCQSIPEIPCLYNNKLNQCISQFNVWSLKCDTAGLNLKGCSMVQQEPCIFMNNKCQKFIDYQSNCIMINNVNALACASIIDQNCIYDSIRLKCDIPIYQSDQCNIPGKNKKFCETNSLCNWNQENLNCKCIEFQSEICKFDKINECKRNINCYFNGNQCIRKQCYHLQEQECNSILDDKNCYLTIFNDCQSASKCEDIIDSKLPCSSFSINSNQCIQAGNQCVSQNNLDLYCLYSDCSNPKCIYEFGICKQKTCSYYSIEDCNKIGDCYLDQNNICQILTSCSQINNYEESPMNICNQLTVQGFRCNWQKMGILDTTEVCTNQPCQLYGSSKKLCHGNEINGYSCILSSSLICQQCEQIIEKCQCENQQQICSYVNGKCVSILCSSFLTKIECLQAQDRCYWSTQMIEDNTIVEQCVIECIKIIDSEECTARKQECYYEPLQMKCLKGQKEIIDLSTDISIEEFYSNILSLLIFIFMLFL